MPKGVHVHKLSNVNQEALTADCANCGEAIPIRMKAGKPRCKESIKTYRQSDAHKEYMRDYMKGRPRKHYKTSDSRMPHGLRVSEARKLREGQACWICGEDDPSKLCVDHCHTEKVIRGILCRAHNTALGLFKDDPAHLARAIEYLAGAPWITP